MTRSLPEPALTRLSPLPVLTVRSPVKPVAPIVSFPVPPFSVAVSIELSESVPAPVAPVSLSTCVPSTVCTKPSVPEPPSIVSLPRPLVITSFPLPVLIVRSTAMTPPASTVSAPLPVLTVKLLSPTPLMSPTVIESAPPALFVAASRMKSPTLENCSDSKATPPLVPLTRFWPRPGLVTLITSASPGVIKVRSSSIEAVTGSRPAKVIAEPSIVRTPFPGIEALGV